MERMAVARLTHAVACRVASCAVLVLWVAACGNRITPPAGGLDADVQATEVSMEAADADAADLPDVVALEADSGPDEAGDGAADAALEVDSGPDVADGAADAVDAQDVQDADAPDVSDAGTDAAAPDEVGPGTDSAEAPDVEAAVEVTATNDADAGSDAEGTDATLDVEEIAAGTDAIAVCDPAACPSPSEACLVAVCNTDNTCGISPAADGTPCDDGDACTTDACASGACLGAKITCNDGNACTDDSCTSATGCVFSTNINPCDDGNACTLADACSATTCLAGPVTACTDDNGCTDDSCKPASGCVNTPNASTCTDSDACTVGEVCSQGFCQGAAFANCNDSNACTDDSCDPSAGCLHVALSGGCDDGSVCTTGDACVNGACAGVVIPCDDGGDCSIDTCDPASGCVHTSANSGACEDGDPCTLASQCMAGTCTATALDPCDDGNVCTTDSCTAGIGCKHVATGFTLCNDGDGCTQVDVCISGVCRGLAPLDCDDANACTADSCTAGVCLHAPVAGNCADANTCTVESCNAGACVHLPVAATCSDANGCTIGDACDAGVCKPGAAVVCPATTQPCTGGLCYSIGSQSHLCFNVALPDGATCDADGNGCTENDACKSGACLAGAIKNCTGLASGGGCTGGACQSTGPASATCVATFASAGVACNDANGCTLGEVCNNSGTCVGGLPIDCSAVAANCFTGQCQATGDFAWTCATGPAKTDGSACDDGSACTQNDACLNAACMGSALLCDDGDACTADSCAPQTGCKHSAILCNDGTLCTVDSCAPATGCLFTPGNDGAVCGAQANCVAPLCSGGACIVPPVAPCDDGNGCTFDYCQPGNQCSNGHALAAAATLDFADAPIAADAGTLLIGGSVFVSSGWNWLTQHTLQGANANDGFGEANALSGDTALIGAPGDDSGSAGIDGNPNDTSAKDSGAAYVFVRSGTTWQQQAYLKASNPMAGALFGSTVAIHGDYAIVGAPEEMGCDALINGDQTWVGCPHGGAAYVFRRTGGTWAQIAYLKGNLINEFKDAIYFGNYVAISDDAILVSWGGSPQTVNFFDLAGNVVTSNPAYVPTNTGGPLALDGHTAAIADVTNQSVAIVEKRDGLWVSTATILSSDAANWDGFGGSIALRGDRLLVGATGEGRAATGIDGDPASPISGFGIGAAFLFQRSATKWTQSAYLKPEYNWDSQEFGYYVALADSFAFVTTMSDSTVSIYALDPQPCNDGNACTTDGCGANGCSHANNAIPCSDGNKCTIDACTAGSCQSTATSGACNDGNACTVNDTCASGACGGTGVCGGVCDPLVCANGTCAYIPKVCADGNPCTVDLCAAGVGCTFSTVAAEQNSLGPDVIEAGSGFGTVAAIAGDVALVGMPNVKGVPKTQATGAVSAFAFVANSWQFKRFITVAQGEAGDLFGCAVGISGTSLVVGAKGESSGAKGVNGNEADNSASKAGAAYALVPNPGNSTWVEQAYLKASNTDAGDGFGSAVAISGDTIVVGAPAEASGGAGQSDNGSPGAGAAYVFVRSGGVWTQQAYLKAANPQAGAAFGSAVSIDGDFIAVGAPNAFGSTPGSGAVAIFTRFGTSWVPTAVLTASNGDPGDGFGAALALGGGTLVVGASGEDSGGMDTDNSQPDSGAAYVFLRQNATWTQQAYLKAAFPDAGDHFAVAVALDGDLLGIGASGEDSAATGVNGDGSNNTLSNSGAAYVFSRSNGSWSPFAYLKSKLAAADGLGGSVALSGGWLLAGVPGTDVPGFGSPLVDAGSARIFRLNQICDDGNPCTNDVCNSTDGCTHTNNTGPCVGGTCGNGICQ